MQKNEAESILTTKLNESIKDYEHLQKKYMKSRENEKNLNIQLSKNEELLINLSKNYKDLEVRYQKIQYEFKEIENDKIRLQKECEKMKDENIKLNRMILKYKGNQNELGKLSLKELLDFEIQLNRTIINIKDCIDQQITCPICFDKLKIIAFIPCGHSLCEQCANRLQICPLCRANVRSKLRIR